MKRASDHSEALSVLVDIFLVLVGQDFLGDINGAVFALLEGPAHVFTNDAETEQLHGSKEQDQHDDGGITGHINTPDQFLQDYHDEIDDGSNRCKSANISGKTKGGSGKKALSL